MKAFPLHILTPEATLFNGEAKEVAIPTSQGEVAVLADHTPVTVLLERGAIRVTLESGEETFESEGGIAIVDESHALRLLLDAAPAEAAHNS